MLLTNAGAAYVAKTTASSLNIRQSAGGAILTTFPENTTVAVIDNTSSSWYQVAANGVVGYASADYIESIEDCDFLIGSGTVTCETAVNLREGSSTESAILTTLSNGTEVSVIGVSNLWYKVQAGSTVGYIHPDYLTITGATDSSTVSRDGSSVSSTLRSQVVEYAKKFLGVPYVYGGTSPKGFDCSGLTYYVYKNMVREIPRTASAQYAASTKITNKSDLRPGDLVFFAKSGKITHVGLYIGNGQFIHSPQTGDVVRIGSLNSGSYSKSFYAGGRFIND
jgi:cell wall-associated NlpC family hydrolase